MRDLYVVCPDLFPDLIRFHVEFSPGKEWGQTGIIFAGLTSDVSIH
jgi:hypothetical protein